MELSALETMTGIFCNSFRRQIQRLSKELKNLSILSFVRFFAFSGFFRAS